MKLKALLLVTAFTLGITASIALAKPPAGKGPNKTTSTSTSTTGTTTTTGKGKKPPKTGPGCKPYIAIVLRGPLVSVGGTSFVMTVKASNKHGLAQVGKNVTVDVDAKTKIKRRGPATLASLVAGDSLNVQARACKAEAATTATLLAKRVVAKQVKGGTTTTTTTTGTTTTSTTETTTTSTTGTSTTGN